MADQKCTFRALVLANEQRSAYGLRYNDFARYRKHCANRTHRLRSSLKLTHGKGREFKKLPPLKPENITDGHLQLYLFEAERAWSYAEELVVSSSLPANKDRASTQRHSATGRFRRAVHWSTQLLAFCQALYSSSRLSAKSLIETTIYTLTLNGRFLRHGEDVENALHPLCVARSLLDKLAETASTSRDQALAIRFSDDIGPEIRYCAHALAHPQAYNIPSIVSEVAPKHEQELVENFDSLVNALRVEASSAIHSKALLAERSWDGEPVPIRYPELVDALLRVENAEAALASGGGDTRGKKRLGVTVYDAVLLALSEADDVGRKLEETQKAGGASTSSSQERDIHFVRAYIVYQLLARRIQRDLLLMNTLLHSESAEKAKPGIKTKEKSQVVDGRLYSALVKLLETILQSLTQMRTLSIVDDNPDLASAVEARIAFINVRRCVYLAKCYSAVKKYAEALSLLQRATIHVRECNSHFSLYEEDPISTSSPAFFELTKDNINEIESTASTDGVQYKRAWFALNGGSVDPEASASYKKPLFFNIALNYVELDMDSLLKKAGKQPAVTQESKPTKAEAAPALEKKLLQKAKEEVRAPTPEPQPAPRSGISSLLGGWWSK